MILILILKTTSRLRQWTNTTIQEMKVFIAILVHQGLSNMLNRAKDGSRRLNGVSYIALNVQNIVRVDDVLVVQSNVRDPI